MKFLPIIRDEFISSFLIIGLINLESVKVISYFYRFYSFISEILAKNFKSIFVYLSEYFSQNERVYIDNRRKIYSYNNINATTLISV